MAFSFTSYSANPAPSLPLPHTLSFPSLSFARVRHTKPQENAKEKRLVIVCVYVCMCMSVSSHFQAQRQQKKMFPKYPSRGLSEVRGNWGKKSNKEAIH